MIQNKYRPTSLEDLWGHEDVVKSLHKALKTDISQQFCFTGPAGLGKTTLARIVAQKLGATRASTIEVDAATHSGVEATRSLTEGMGYVPFNGEKKAYIIDECHALSKASWQALLKSIEEPPAHVIWVLCSTETSRIPETIKSRCLHYDLKPISSSDLYENLLWVIDEEACGTSDEVARLISRSCDGSPRKALTALGICAGLSDPKKAGILIKTLDESDEVINVCRALFKNAGWNELMRVIKGVPSDGETARRQIMRYASKVASGSKEPSFALSVLEAFSDPYPSGSSIEYVIRDLGRVLYGE